jgi:hypothetical protein
VVAGAKIALVAPSSGLLHDVDLTRVAEYRAEAVRCARDLRRETARLPCAGDATVTVLSEGFACA